MAQKDFRAFHGKQAVLARKGESPANVIVQEVNPTHVACQFENGGVLYVPHGEIESLEAGKVKVEAKADAPLVDVIEKRTGAQRMPPAFDKPTGGQPMPGKDEERPAKERKP